MKKQIPKKMREKECVFCDVRARACACVCVVDGEWSRAFASRALVVVVV